MANDQNFRIKIDYENKFSSKKITKDSLIKMNIDKFES